MLLVYESEHLQTQFIDVDTQTYLKGKCPSAGGKLIFTALEQVPRLFSIIMLAYPESAILLHRYTLHTGYLKRKQNSELVQCKIIYIKLSEDLGMSKKQVSIQCLAHHISWT